MLTEVVTMHESVRSMSRVSSDRLKQPSRLNGGWFSAPLNFTIVWFDNN